MLELRWECEAIGPEDDALVPAGPIYLSGVVSLDEQATRVAALTSGRVQAGAMLRCDELIPTLALALALALPPTLTLTLTLPTDH